MNNPDHPENSDNKDQPRVFTVDPSAAGQRLDVFLAEHCPDLSRSRIQADLAAECVLVAGRLRPKGFRLKAGSRVSYNPQPLPELRAEPQDIPLNILHQDEEILVLDKPARLVVHPSIGHPDGTLVNAVLHHCGKIVDGGDPLRPGIVHRLDRDTTGVMVVALTERAHRSLSLQLKERTMGRTYLALSWGQWDADQGSLDGNIGRNLRRRQQMAVLPSGGRPACTDYLVSEDFGFVQFCRVRLQTGRTHQIRVHFAHHHHPIVGDHLYGDDNRAKRVHPLDRQRAARMVSRATHQLLHAVELQLAHPATGEELNFTAPLPEEFSGILDDLRAGG